MPPLSVSETHVNKQLFVKYHTTNSQTRSVSAVQEIPDRYCAGQLEISQKPIQRIIFEHNHIFEKISTGVSSGHIYEAIFYVFSFSIGAILEGIVKFRIIIPMYESGYCILEGTFAKL